MRSTKYYVHFALVFATTMCTTLAQNQEPKVNTTFGSVRGVWLKTARDADVAGFLGLPYALPPLGDLRFENPQPWTEKWNDTRNATTDGSQCLQVTKKGKVVGDEDCLYLNVFTPTISKAQNATTNKKLSVIVFIYGGGFNRGSSHSKFYAPTYLLDHEIVLVTLNYRLNVFGFFSTGNDVTPGNYGLKDIAMALRWIHDNVESFGGNPNSVTLAGLSSGAVAIELLSASKVTEGHFHKMITMSGWTSAPWAFHTRESIRNSSMTVASRLKCNNSDDFEEDLGSGGGEIETTTIIEETVDEKKTDLRIVQCMKNVSAIDLVNAQFQYAWRHNPACVLGPTLEAESEGAIVTVHPAQAPYRDIPWITGVTTDEGLIKSINIYLSTQIKTELLQHYNDYLIPYILELENIAENNTAAAIKAITDYYFNGSVTANNLDANITQVYGDCTLTWPSYDGLQKRAKNMKSNVYFYQFGYTGTFSTTFQVGYPINLGVSHGDDLNYLFPYLNAEYAEFQYSNSVGDVTIINIMSEMWTNFAKTGKPSARLTTSWEPYQKHARYMRIGDHENSNITMEVNFMPERMAFWTDFEKKYTSPIKEYRVGGDDKGESGGGKDHENKGGEKSKGGAAGVEAGLTVLVSIILCWTSSL